MEEEGYDAILHLVYLGGIVADTKVSNVRNTANNMDIKASTKCTVYAGGIIGNGHSRGDSSAIPVI